MGEPSPNDPFALLYANMRECPICLVTKSEPEFLYSTACAHVFCLDCVKRNRSNKCMLCRADVNKLLHVTAEGSLYRITEWRDDDGQQNDCDNLQDIIRSALEIANIALVSLLVTHDT